MKAKWIRENLPYVPIGLGCGWFIDELVVGMTVACISCMIYYLLDLMLEKFEKYEH